MNFLNRLVTVVRSSLVLRCAILCATLLGGGAAWAQENSIQSIGASKQGNNIIVKIAMKKALAAAPLNFSISNPARIAIDFQNTSNDTGNSSKEISLGDVRNANIVQVGDRSRIVFNLNRSMNYALAIDGNNLVVTIDSSGGVATAVNTNGLPANPVVAAPSRQALRDLDFRHGTSGEGRIVVGLPNNQIAADVRQQGNSVIVTFQNASVPPVLRRKMDVTDFGTPVSSITTVPEGENVRMTIEARGLWEHSVYQTESQLIVEVKPIKEDPNKVTQGSQGYRGEKMSVSFQNIDVRAILQVIGDFTGFNVIASDSVQGSLTLKLKDVPWDQVLDVVMQAKNLDMRKNGSVLWIAPKDEILSKEKLEAEQKAQIAELEPLKLEIFQLNYQKAEDFKKVFGLDNITLGAAGAGGPAFTYKLLSKRGSVSVDPRTNQLFVTDIQSKLDEIRQLVRKTDVPSRQVLIEARMVVANSDWSRNLGAKLGFVDLRGIRGGDAGYQLAGNNRVAVTGNYAGVGQQTLQASQDGSGTGSGLSSGSYSPNSQFVNLPAASIGGVSPTSVAVSLFSAAANRFLDLELSALEADNNGRIISSPRVMTADQLKATVEQGTEIPYQNATSSGATSTAFKKANLRLEVTPQITPDGMVMLEVDVANDSPGASTPGGLAINTKHVNTKVLVENGGTVVLGGIFTQEERNQDDKTPILGDIPVIGSLFKTTAKTNTKSEMLVFITPKIMTDKVTSR